MSEWEGFIAVSSNNFGLIKKMLCEKRLEPDLDFKGATLITTAINRNATPILKLLLENGANPNKKSNENGRYEPPVFTATRLKHLHLVKLLEEHGADTMVATNFYGENVMYQAVVSNAFDILIHFLQTKPHMNTQHLKIKMLKNLEHDRQDSNRYCSFRLAALEAEKFPSKLKCLKIFFKYQYDCKCYAFEYDRFSACSCIHFKEFDSYKNTEVLEDIFKWYYLTHGEDLLLNIRRKNKNMKLKLPKPLPIKLSNLARISIRKDASFNAYINCTTFYNEILKLPLPPTLINFLLMSDLNND